MNPIAYLLTTNLHSLRQLQTTLSIYIALGPFTRLAANNSDTLNRLKEVILPNNINHLSKLIHSYRVQPPLSVTAIRPSLMGLLVHAPISEQYSENALRNLVTKCADQLNDGVRQLNENQLQEKELRSCLISCRNELQAILTIFPQQSHQNAISKVIDWIF